MIARLLSRSLPPRSAPRSWRLSRRVVMAAGTVPLMSAVRASLPNGRRALLDRWRHDPGDLGSSGERLGAHGGDSALAALRLGTRAPFLWRDLGAQPTWRWPPTACVLTVLPPRRSRRGAGVASSLRAPSLQAPDSTVRTGGAAGTSLTAPTIRVPGSRRAPEPDLSLGARTCGRASLWRASFPPWSYWPRSTRPYGCGGGVISGATPRASRNRSVRGVCDMPSRAGANGVLLSVCNRLLARVQPLGDPPLGDAARAVVRGEECCLRANAEATVRTAQNS